MKNYKILPIRIEEKTYKKLKKIAFMNETSMAQFIRDLIEKKLISDEKVIDT